MRADAGAAGTVIHLVSRRDASDVDDAANRNSLGRDVGRGTGLVGDGVVARVSTTVTAGQRYGLASANVLAVKQPGGGYGKCVSGYQPCVGSVAGIHTGRAVGVIDLVGSADAAHAQRLLRHIGRGAGLIGDAVVTHVCAAVTAHQRYRLARADVLVVERSGCANVDRIARYQAGLGHSSGVDTCHVVAIVDFAGSGDASNCQSLGCHIGRRRFLVGDAVVAHVSAAVTAHQRYCLARADVLVTERSGCGNIDRIARHQAGLGHSSGVDTCHVVAIVDFAGSGDASNCQSLGCHIGRRRCLVGDAVVAHVSAAVAAR